MYLGARKIIVPYRPPVVAPPPAGGLSTPTEVGSGTVSGNGDPVTGSFTPSNNSLLVAVVAGRANNASLTCTFSGGSLTWTTDIDETHAGFQVSTSIGWAEVSTGASMTVTAGASHIYRNAILYVYELTGYDTADPTNLTGQTSGYGPSGAQNISLGGTSSSDGVVMAAAAIKNTAGAPTVDEVDTGTGWTQLNELVNDDGGNHILLQTQYFEGAKANAEWADITSSGNSHACIGLEINAA